MITGLYLGLLALMYLGLSVYVIAARLQGKIGMGDGGDETLIRRIRIHGNFAEFVPIQLLLLLCLELQNVDAIWLHVTGLAILLGRVFHAWGLIISPYATWQRQAGMMLTFAVLALGGLSTIALYFL